MSQTIESTRFGRLDIADEAVIEFPGGLIGLGGSRYTLLVHDPDGAFAWLHSMDDPQIALPVTNPFAFFDDYEVELSDADVERTGITDAADVDVWVTVRTGEELADFHANLLAPILVSHGRGWQVINEVPGAPVKARLFPEVAEQAA